MLGELDQKYNVTEKVIEALDELSETIQGSVETQKQKIVDAGNEYVNSVAESVIDYVIDSAQQILINTAKHMLRKFITPQFR